MMYQHTRGRVTPPVAVHSYVPGDSLNTAPTCDYWGFGVRWKSSGELPWGPFPQGSLHMLGVQHGEPMKHRPSAYVDGNRSSMLLLDA